MRRHLLVAVPVLLLIAAAVLPLAAGSRTLFLRDAFNTHLPMKWFGAEALAAGEVPAVDPHRGGGQPHRGNPNAVPLYPDDLLYLVAPVLWAFNAHFWLHLLLAPCAFVLLGRVWGLEPEAAWAAGAAYGLSGFFLSQMNLYNLVAGAALAPAFVAACLGLGRRSGRHRGRWLAAAAALWALLLLAGDPVLAAVALVAALLLVAADERRRPLGRLAGPGAAALALGSALAAPQLVELLRVVPLSFRGYQGYSPEAATAASWPPAALAEWFLPLVFGPPDLTFWGQALHDGQPPLFYSLFPGPLVLALVASTGLPRRRAERWAWGMVLLGLFVALGRHNPLLAPLLELPGAGLLRFPVKLWLLVAIGGALLAGRGAQRLLAGERRPLGRAIAALAALHLGVWGLLGFFPGPVEGWLRGVVPAHFGDDFVRGERLRWAGLALLLLLLLAAAALLLRLARRRPALAVALLAALHAASQLFFLRPLLATDDPAAYSEPPAVLAALPDDPQAAHGEAHALFGGSTLTADAFPDARLTWLQRRRHAELAPPAGVRWGVRYRFQLSPEGLDSFLTRAATQAIARADDPERVRLLEAAGVERLLLGRPLEGVPPERARPVGTYPVPGGEIRAYALPRAAPEVALVAEAVRSPNLTATLGILTGDGFDARRTVVLPGEEGAAAAVERLAGGGASGGRLRVVARDAGGLEAEVESPSPAYLVWQRAWLPIYRAEVNGARAPIEVANLDAMAVRVPAGASRVRVAVDGRAWVAASGVSVAAVLVLVALAVGPRRGSRGEQRRGASS